MTKKTYILFLFLFLVTNLWALERKITVSGTVTDSENGEDLIGAFISVSGTNVRATTNEYGFYSLTLPRGSYTLNVVYISYKSQSLSVELSGDQKINFALKPSTNELEEVVVSAERKNANVSKPEMSVERLSSKTIKAIPALMGEVDVIKAIQLLPGVQAAAEGTSGFSVRGGGHDQNLILLDEATVYNASHLMGFFSVFNNDAVHDVKLYKGDIPATFGGRLSSLMDIRTKNGNNQRLSGTGGVGLISSRLTLEGPVTDRATFLVAGRRTYADLFLKLASDKDLRQSSLYFYDLNLKFNYRIDDNNRIFVAGYLGKDNFSTNFAGMNFGNKTFTVRWNHIFSPRLFSNFTLIGSIYDYYLKTDFAENMDQDWKSQLQDYGVKGDFTYNLNARNNLKFGYNYIFHNFILGKGGGVGENSIVTRISFPKEYAAEQAMYVSNETSVGEKLTLKYGLRYGIFQNISNGEEVNYLDNYEVAYSKKYKKGKIYKTQGRLEPRFGALFQFNDEHSLKTSYSRTAQYIQVASNSSAGSPLDVWFQASQNIKPQLCDQFAFGYFRNFSNNDYEASAEVYYKDMKNVVDFKDHAQLVFNKDLEQEVRFGKGYSYGLELMLRKNTGRLSGWLSYTWSRSWRKVDEVYNESWYRSPYDRPHNVSVVLNYELNPKWTLSSNWVYTTGTPVTYPTGRYLMENKYVPIYSGRNEYRYPAYHRLDLSATCKLSKPESKVKTELNFSVYNAYGRKNPWTIFFQQEDNNPDVLYGEMLYLFSFVPSVTLNFTF